MDRRQRWCQLFDPMGLPRWKTAYGELLAPLASEDIQVVGRAYGLPELVPGCNFVACPVDYPFQDIDLDLHFSGELYLESYPHFGEKESHLGGDDSLRIGRQTRWTGIVIEKEAVARCWPFALVEGNGPAENHENRRGRKAIRYAYSAKRIS